MMPSIFQTFEVIEKEVGVTHDDGGPQKLAKKHSGSEITNDNDIVLYLFDISQTLLSLLQTLPILCEHFFKVGLVPRLVSFYEEVVPLLREKYRGTSLKSARTYLKRCDSGLIKLFRLIMNVYCLDPLFKRYRKIFPLNYECVLLGALVSFFSFRVLKHSLFLLFIASHVGHFGVQNKRM